MIDIRNLKLVDLLPPNLAQDPKVKAAAEALDKELQAVTAAIDECLLLPRLDDLSEAVLDHLAWERHVDFYEPDLPIEQKRELVRRSLPWHRRKGTPAAVEELVIAIFGDGQVKEWYEYSGLPYHFKVLTNNGAATTTEVQRFTRAIDSVKNRRSVLEAVEITLTEQMDLYLGGAVHIGEYYEARQVA